MNRLLLALLGLVCLLSFARPASADTDLALGLVGHGAVGNLADRQDGHDWSAGGGGSMFLEIPLMKSFHLSPAITFTGLGGVLSTESALVFKFVLPLPTLALFLGLGPCGEARNDRFHPGLVAEAGLWTHLFGSLAFIAQTRFSEYSGDGYRETFQVGAGLLLFL
jgi:hypothetical protein